MTTKSVTYFNQMAKVSFFLVLGQHGKVSRVDEGLQKKIYAMQCTYNKLTVVSLTVFHMLLVSWELYT